MSDADQSVALAFLAKGSTHGLRGAEPMRVRTHISEVFLVGDRALKVKRAVRYAFVDFSTLGARRAACEAEIRLNRRTAPDIYLGVGSVRRDQAGRLSFDKSGRADAGEPIEWVVVMRRFDERLTFDRLADQRALRADWIDAVVDGVIDLHEGAETFGAPYGGRDGPARLIAENSADMATLRDNFSTERLDALIGAQHARLAACTDLLDSRRAAGQVRRCHGDLHLGNVVLWRDHPTIFDCIEFSDHIAIIDVAYDLAFLLMDLEIRGLRALANRAASRYLGRQGGMEVLAALPLMMSLRAAVRAKVTAMTIATAKTAEEASRYAEQAERFFRAAARFVEPAPPPCLIAVGGLSGTGKSTLAGALAPELGRAPGALWLRSDVIRKRLAQVPPERRLPEAAYTEESNRRVYETLLREAGLALAAGQHVVVDAVFGREQERRACEAVARAAGVTFLGFWLEAFGDALKERVARRTADASDATPDVVARQLTYDTGPIAWSRLDSSPTAAVVLENARALLPAGVYDGA